MGHLKLSLLKNRKPHRPHGPCRTVWATSGMTSYDWDDFVMIFLISLKVFITIASHYFYKNWFCWPTRIILNSKCRLMILRIRGTMWQAPLWKKNSHFIANFWHFFSNSRCGQHPIVWYARTIQYSSSYQN